MSPRTHCQATWTHLIDDLCTLVQSSSSGGEPPGGGGHDDQRDRFFFAILQTTMPYGHFLLPRLIKERRDTKKLRRFVAAASTGQEAYSLADASARGGVEATGTFRFS